MKHTRSYEDLWHRCMIEDKHVRRIAKEISDEAEAERMVWALPDASALHVRLHRNHRTDWRASVLDAIDCGRAGGCQRLAVHLLALERDPRGFGDDWRGYAERLPRLTNDELARELSHIDWDSDPEGGVSLYGNTGMPAALVDEAIRRLAPDRAILAGQEPDPCPASASRSEPSSSNRAPSRSRAP